MADHKDVQDKLRNHLRKVYDKARSERRQPTVTEMTKSPTPYLDAVNEEILRVASVLPFTAREALCDTTLLGHHIPKGTMVTMCSAREGYLRPPLPVDEAVRSESSKSRKETRGEWDPETIHLFMPERWLKLDESGNEVYDSQAGPFNAFSNGPRGCFGRRLAYLELRVVIALLVWNFELNKCPEALSSYGAGEKITSLPTHCYVSLAKIEC